MTKFTKFEYVEPEIENRRHKKIIFSRLIWLRKMHLLKSSFKVQDTTKSVIQKRCEMVRLIVTNLLYTNQKSILGCLNCNFLNFLKESNNFKFWAIFITFKCIFPHLFYLTL